MRKVVGSGLVETSKSLEGVWSNITDGGEVVSSGDRGGSGRSDVGCGHDFFLVGLEVVGLLVDWLYYYITENGNFLNKNCKIFIFFGSSGRIKKYII